MKITPVTGTTPISGSVGSGANPDKMDRAKAIAGGSTPDAPKEEARSAFPSPPGIKLKVNSTVHREVEAPPEESQATLPADATKEAQSNISDANAETKGGEEKPNPLSPQMAALAKERRALQKRARELADKEKALGLKAELESRIKSEPLRVLQELGVTYDKLTEDILAQQNGGAEAQAVRSEVKTLKEDFQKQLADRDQKLEQNAILYRADQLDSLVAQNQEEFEFITATNGQEEVIRRVYNHYKETGEELNLLTTARTYEKELEEQYTKLRNLKKAQKLMTPAPVQQDQPVMKTLTNKNSVRPVMDRKQRAILAMLNKLPR